MKKIVIALAAFAAAILSANAQQTLTVDLAEVFQNYYKVQEAQAKFSTNLENAQDEVRKMIDDGRAMTEEFQKLAGNAQNPALTEDARKKFAEEAKAKGEEIRRKEAEINTFRQQTDQNLAQRRQNILTLHLNEVKVVVADIAKKRGATLVVNSSGTGVLFHSDSLDITKEVLSQLNADKPK